MRRTGAITQKVPTFSSDDYKTFMIGDFKGIDKSVNPFNAIKSSAEECLNLYVDDEGTLTTRPRLDCQSDIVGDELNWNPTEDAIRNSFEFDYNGVHYHAITTNKRRANEKTYWGLSSDFITWESFVDDGGNTVSELFNNGDVLYAVIKNGIYTTTIDFTTNKISFTKALAYVPTTGTYDAASGVRVTAGEQENFLTDKFKTEVFWKPADVKSEAFRDLSFELDKNNYYDKYEQLAYNNSGVTKYKAYPASNTILACIDNTRIVVFDTAGKVTAEYVLPQNISSIDFDYYANSTAVCIAYTYTRDSVKYISAIEYSPTQQFTLLNPISCESSCQARCCVIESTGEMIITGAVLKASVEGIVVKLNATNTINRRGDTTNETLANFDFVWWSPALSCFIAGGLIPNTTNTRVYMFYNTVTSSEFDTPGNYITLFNKQPNTKWHLTNTASKTFINFDSTHEEVQIASWGSFFLVNEQSGWVNFDDGTGFIIKTDATSTTLTLNDQKFWESTEYKSSTATTKYTILFANGSFFDSAGYLLKYKASTKPELTIIETQTEPCPDLSLEHVGRYNNNYVYWSTTSNKVYYAANNNPLYIPKSFYDDYGDDTPVTGVMRISDSYLAVLKKDATYLAWYDSETGYFYANELRTEKGNIAIAQAIVCNYSNLPVVINTDGFWGLGQSTSVNYQDTVYSSLSDALRVELQKLDLTKCKTHNHKYLTYFAVPNGDSTTVYVLDNRIQMWFKWVIPIDLKFFAEYEDYTYIYTATSVFKLDPYTAHTNGDLNDAWYADTVNAVGSTKHIPWLWVSQPLYLGTLNYKKRIRYMKFLFDNKYESESVTMRYGFLSYKQSERPTKLREYTSPFTRNTFSNEITGITKEVATLKTKKIRPYIPSFDFIQIILRSNNDSDEFEDADGNIITPTLNDKVGLIGLTINYILQEG